MKRYKTGGYGAMIEDSDGSWVLYSEAAEQIRELRHELESATDRARTSHELLAAETRAREAEALLNEHSKAAAIFQPGGRFHKRAIVALWGRDAVVEGINWLVKQLDAAEGRR